ncbi:MAG: nucleotidyltransferase domain-containing protein [Lachnospiraceae bacterium]|nr:nucleotidyltransferase domain-containing protein [Lachnospiraceae bacterium]
MHIEEILELVVDKCKHHGIEEAILFGSWAKGTENRHSDIDIAVVGVKDIEKLREDIENIPTLRSFDIVDIKTCKNELLIKEIKQYGRKIL